MTPQELLVAVQAKFPTVTELPKAEGQTRGDELYLSVTSQELPEVCRYIRFDPPLSGANVSNIEDRSAGFTARCNRIESGSSQLVLAELARLVSAFAAATA